MKVYSISAITLKVNEMKRSCQFYSKIPGFRIVYGGSPDSTFSTFEIGEEEKRKTYLNLELIVERTERQTSPSKLSEKLYHHRHDYHSVEQESHDYVENSSRQDGAEQEGSRRDFGRIIFHTENVDDLYSYLKNDEFFSNHAMFETEPADAPWGERFFHIREPDGYQLSFAQPPKR